MTAQDNWNWNEDFKNYFYSDNIRSLINEHHINSYNDFIENKINKILNYPIDDNNDRKGLYYNRIKKGNPLQVSIEFVNENYTEYKKPRVETSTLDDGITSLTPNLCINRNLDYKGKLIVDVKINITYEDNNKEKNEEFYLKGVKLCELPVMIYSNECFLYKKINKIINYEKKNIEQILDYKIKILDSEIKTETNIILKKQKEKEKQIYEEDIIFIKLYNTILKNCKFYENDFWKHYELQKLPDYGTSIQKHIQYLNEKQQYEIIDKIKKYVLYLHNENIFEYGGYFIINGKEKLIISQDRLCNNKLYIKYDRVGINEKTKKPIYEYTCEVKSVDIEVQDFKPAKTTYIRMKKHKYSKKNVPDKFKTDSDKKIEKQYNDMIGILQKLKNFFIEFEKSNYYNELIPEIKKTLFTDKKEFIDDEDKIISIVNTYTTYFDEKLKEQVEINKSKQDETTQEEKEQLKYLEELIENFNKLKIFLIYKNKEQNINTDNYDISTIYGKDKMAEGSSIEEKAEKLGNIMLEHDNKNVFIDDTDYNICVKLKDFDDTIPIYIIFRALGFESDMEIINFIMNDINMKNNEYKYIQFKTILDNCRYEADIKGIYTKNQALLYIYNCLAKDKQFFNESKDKLKNIYKYINNKLFYVFLPHCSSSIADDKSNNNKKALFFGYSIQSLLHVFFGYEKITDRDTYKFKRIDSTGKLLSSLFRDWYENLIGHLRSQISLLKTSEQIKTFIEGIKPLDGSDQVSDDYKEKVNKLEDYFIHKDKRKPYLESIITEGFRKAFRGQWGVKQVTVNVTLDNLFQQINRDNYSFNKEGIAQELNRMSHIDTISHLRRVQTPMDSSIKITGPRLLNTTQYGYICPLDTPEGALSGLVKNLSIQARVSSFNGNNLENIKRFFENDDLQNIFISTDNFILTQDRKIKYNNFIKIFINNNWLYSYVGKPKEVENYEGEKQIISEFRCDEIYKFFKLMKKNNIIDYDTSISWNIIKKEIHFFIDEGRYLRPVYNIDKWEELGIFDKINEERIATQQEEQQTVTQQATEQEIAILLQIETDKQQLSGELQKILVAEEAVATAAAAEKEIEDLLNSSNYIKKSINTDENMKVAYIEGINMRISKNEFGDDLDKILRIIDLYEFYKLDKFENLYEFWKNYKVILENLKQAKLTQGGMEEQLVEQGVVDERKPYGQNVGDNYLIRKYTGNINFNKLSNHRTKHRIDIDEYIKLFINIIKEDRKPNEEELKKLNLDKYVAVEFIDPEESDITLISISETELQNKINCEYMDIHPSLIFGGLTSSMSFLNHNPCVRATYSHAQSKQSIAIPTTNFNHRFDTKMLVLNYPQKSMHITKNASLINYNELPTGNNAIVAMCTYLGYNQEDGIIINQSSMDRGMYVATHYKTYYVELEDEEELRPPETIKNKRKENYNKINENECFVQPGKYVDEKDIIISKIYSGSVEVDTSVAMEKTPFKEIRTDSEDAGAGEEQGFEEASGGFVTQVQTGLNSDKKRYIKIKVASTSQPDIADKFCSRYANKGVISLTVPTENMPYTKSGITPDIMINPHSIPSRMTVSNLLEIFTGKISAESGYYINGSPFENNDSTFEPPDNNEKSMLDLLKYYGFENRGNEIMYNGLTGEMFSAKIFIGPAYYQRLKHIVRDKVNARNGGEGNPVDQVTRQPIKGRKRGGGIRIGEMEKDSLISHGTSQFLKESMLDRSDIYSCIVCKLCGRIAIHNINNNKEINCCKHCDNKQYFTQITIPYCTKLLIQEFEAASVTYRLVTEDLIH